MTELSTPTSLHPTELRDSLSGRISLVDQVDAEKLHAESLQLRNQQFFLSTVALAGSGLSAWLGPGLASITEGKIAFVPLAAATTCWLLLLAFLYGWTLALRRMIHVIGWYLQQAGLSNWEPRFRKFSEDHQRDLFFWRSDWQTRYLQSQNNYYFWAFLTYGCVAWTGSFVAGGSNLWPLWPIRSISLWSLEQGIMVLVFVVLLIAYVAVLLVWGGWHRTRDHKIDKDWDKLLKNPN